jgi:hypothetical protein
MTTSEHVCMHPACSCIAPGGEYCSDYCRRAAADVDELCGCGHRDCAGTAALEEPA